MKRLRTLKLFQIFITEIKKSKTYSGLCPFQGLSNGTTLMQIQSGRTVPLTHAVAGFNSDEMTYEFRLWSSQCTVKKGSGVSRLQPGCHYQTLPGWEL
jgi:hypothetical protein